MEEQVEIPGYRILRTLGRGGMATVYLAEQTSVQREVALKIMSPALGSDEHFGKRFLREGRIAANLRHPNVVQVYDVGISGEYHYIAMEYLPGGAIMDRSGAPRSVAFALAVVSEIASALDYAGARGIVHRDIKPDNILLREDGSAVLTDFGIARASDASKMTRTGAIVGTPYYMSPEQARGHPLDGRADIYSLGVVLYELLTGDRPYQAADSLAIGIMHITAPLPRLPGELGFLQPLLDRMLAKSPRQRYQRGAEVVSAIAGIPQRAGALSETRVMPAFGPPAVDWQAGVEPRLGRLDEIVDTPTRVHNPVVRPRRRVWPWLVAAVGVVALLGAGGYLFQDQLRAQLPQTQMNQLLADAADALRDGRLAEGERSARTLYQAALARDPDNQRARSGLHEVGQRLMAQARRALAQGDPAPARQLIEMAGELVLPSSEVVELVRELQAQEMRDVELGGLLEAARAAVEANRLDGTPDSALGLYRRVLELEPGNVVATAGLRSVLARLLDQAKTAARAGDLEQAHMLVDRVSAIDPGHLGLPDARADLASVRQDQKDSLGRQLESAEALLARGHLMPPRQPNAMEIFQGLLAEEPSLERARQGVQRIGQALLSQAERQIDDYHFERAEALIDQAAQLVPAVPGLVRTRQHLEEVRGRRDRFEARQQADTGEIPMMLQRARDATRAGQFLIPPGESAFDLYRAVLARVPDHPEARAGLADLPDHAMRRFNEAMAGNRLGAARDAVQALEVIAPTDSRLTSASARLARSYLAYASERLGAGELDLAARAFDQARELDPDNTDLPALQARLEQARGG